MERLNFMEKKTTTLQVKNFSEETHAKLKVAKAVLNLDYADIVEPALKKHLSTLEKKFSTNF